MSAALSCIVRGGRCTNTHHETRPRKSNKMSPISTYRCKQFIELVHAFPVFLRRNRQESFLLAPSVTKLRSRSLVLADRESVHGMIYVRQRY